MELLKSKKFKLPTLYFITDREEIKDIPIGVPFIYGDEKDKKYIIRLLEYEILYQKALSSGLPFNFRKILKDQAYTDLVDFGYQNPVYIDYITENKENYILEDNAEILTKEGSLFKQCIKDGAAIVNVEKLKDLNVFPVWLDDIEKAVETNIHNFAVYNPNMYNKKLEGMYGALELISPNRNLLIVDISASIPKGVSSTLLVMSKSLAESFYADILITGKISVLYEYEILHELNVEQVYEEVGMSNEQAYFKKLVTTDEKHYKTLIAFGDNHHPGDKWGMVDSYISDSDGKKMCKWKVDKLISFHTHNNHDIAGYARWFDIPENNIERISNWVKYLE